MGDSALEDLATLDATGRPLFQVAATADGDLVLCRPSGALQDGLRALEVHERVRLAVLSVERPALVVESTRGDYVVVIDEGVDLERYAPLAPVDARMLARTAARARFGRRDDDVLTLTPWAEDDDVVLVDLDAPGFTDVPVVERLADGTLAWHRGDSGQELAARVERDLERLGADPGTRFGVLTNPLGECLCVPEGEPLPPHEDIRHQTLVATATVLEGVGNLRAAAARLRSFAAQLDAAADDGWRLVEPVGQGIGFLERARR
ncbi:MAG TPA: hypothetical protein VM324_06465 [Egibacteraceae bacterium]|jgi:hypothetical protein|nr:hypothetical protein [Egibacteraceae bacterium]